MAAGEDQAQTVVVHGTLLDGLGLPGGLQAGRFGVAIVARRLAAQAIDRAIAGGGDDPTRRGWRQSVDGPALEGDGERILDGFLGKVDVAEEADQDRNGAG